MGKVTRLRQPDQEDPLRAAAEAFSCANRPRHGAAESRLDPWFDAIQFLLGKDYTLEQVRQFLAANQVRISTSGIWMYLRRRQERALRAERARLAAATVSVAACPDPPARTLGSRLSDAELCRRNGWGAGTLLAGDEGHGVTVIRITAVGEDNVLAREVCHAGKPAGDLAAREAIWTLTCRDWRHVSGTGEQG